MHSYAPDEQKLEPQLVKRIAARPRQTHSQSRREKASNQMSMQ